MNSKLRRPYVRETVIGYNNEDLFQRFIRMQRVGFGLTGLRVCCTKWHTQDLFNAESKTDGWAWYFGFMQRHPNISLRKSQAISFTRAQCMNRPQVDAFFNMLGAKIVTETLKS